ncbi:hypothetical protein PYCC9005_001222 [Savitreella phatthalungensis]
MTRSIREKSQGPKHSDSKGHILDPHRTAKRSGSGKGNWGSVMDDIDDMDTAYGVPSSSSGGAASRQSSFSSNLSTSPGSTPAINMTKPRRRSNSQSHTAERARMIARFEAEEPVVDEI